MNDDIRAEFERPLQKRGEECVVDDGKSVEFMRNRRYRTNVKDVEQRIAWSLDPNGACIGTHCVAQTFRIRHVEKAHLNAELISVRSQEPFSPAVAIMGAKQMIAAFEKMKRYHDGCHACGNGGCRRSSFKQRDVLFESQSGGISASGVVKTLCDTYTFEPKCGGRVNGVVTLLYEVSLSTPPWTAEVWKCIECSCEVSA